MILGVGCGVHDRSEGLLDEVVVGADDNDERNAVG